jgi:ABC-type branched-subunit amino acid transport system ATPase component/predicted MFS family arabinose efflux permease
MTVPPAPVVDPSVARPATAASSGVSAAAAAEAAMEPPPSHLFWLDPRRITWPASVVPLLVLAGLAAMAQFEGSAFSVLVPDIRLSFHLSLTGLATITAVTAPVGLLLDIPVAYAGDRVHRMRMTCIGFLIFMAFSALTAVSGVFVSLTLLYVARLGVSVGSAFQSTGSSLMADFFPVGVRAKAYFARAAIGAALGAVAPATVGLIELRFDWEAPFVIFAVPTVVFVVLGLMIKEPVRGRYERELMGADPVTAAVTDEPASLTETFRTLFANRSMRRLYYSLPFLSVAALGIGQFTSLFYQSILHLDAASRGFVTAATAPGAVVGLIFGGAVLRPLIWRRPDTVMRLIAVSATLAGGLLVGFALAPNVWVAAVFQFLLGGVMATIVPGVTTLVSLVIPPRMRTLGFATTSIWFLIGVPVLPLVGVIGDDFGLRVGIIVFVPVFVVGGYILASGGAFIARDIDKVRVSTLARAELRQARLEGRTQLLMVRGVRAGYGPLDVLFDVDLDVADGEMLALLGTNGAGKSTILRTVSALLVPTAGAVMFDGIDITSADPRRVVEMGVVHVPGGRGIFPGLTVAENLALALGPSRRRRRSGGEGLGGASSVEEVFDFFPPLRSRLHTAAGELSGGEQQMLSLGQAFLFEPKLLLIDELSLGLAPSVVTQLIERVKAVHQAGTAVVLVDQSLSTAMAVSERAAFMERGQVMFSGPTSELIQRDDLARAVFLSSFTGPAASVPRSGGEAVASVAGPPPAPAGAPVLSATGLVKRYGGVTVLDGVDLELYDGEVVGLIGPNGAGKTTLLDLVTGAQGADGGRVVLGGRDVTGWSMHRRAAAGIARTFQEPRLWSGLTVEEILSVGVARRHGGFKVTGALLRLPVTVRRERAIRDEVDEIVELLHLESFRLKFPTELSTGTRRIVELATVVAQRPRLLLLDEPTVGIAQRETEPLAALLREVGRELGCAMLVIEHDMAFLRGLAGRAVAIDAGAVIARGTPEDVLASPEVLRSYLGLDPGSVQIGG